MLDHVIANMVAARSRQQGSLGHPDTSQLLLMVSDGRGLFLEGMEVVKSAVRKAREANVFLVFVIIDNPQNKVIWIYNLQLFNDNWILHAHIWIPYCLEFKKKNMIVYFAGLYSGYPSSSFQRCWAGKSKIDNVLLVDLESF